MSIILSYNFVVIKKNSMRKREEFSFILFKYKHKHKNVLPGRIHLEALKFQTHLLLSSMSFTINDFEASNKQINKNRR